MLMWSTQSPCAAQLINFLPSGVTTAPATPGMSMREAASHFLGVGANRAKIDKSNFKLQKTLPSLDFATVDGQKI